MKLTRYHFIIAAIALLVSSSAWAGHHYKGHCGTMSSWNMNEMDANQDGVLSFEEFSDRQTKKLRAGYDMIDSNSDGVVSEEEWKTFLNVHGVDME